jgi:outer membrane protein assembly factor BamA
LALNPYFFKDVNTSVQYFSLEYAFEGDYRDRRPVASEGYRFSLKLQKDGLGAYQQINQATLTLAYEQYFKISKHLTAILAPKARFHFTRDMNGYFFNNALSGDNLIRGYESYVIDGKDFIYANTGVRWNAFNTEINMGRLMPLKNMRQIPIAFFLGINCDAGIVFDPDFGSLNRFDNKILMGYGPFVQFLLYEHFLLSVEYNFNILQDGGMHIRSGVNF